MFTLVNKSEGMYTSLYQLGSFDVYGRHFIVANAEIRMSLNIPFRFVPRLELYIF